MKIGDVALPSPMVVSPMAGMTDTAFRRLVKRQGGCGLVVTEMVSSEGLVRGIDRTLEYAEYTEEERPVSIQIFGGDPDKMAEAARIVEGMGANIVDINMGCPVAKISKHNAGCRLMREPKHAAVIVAAMVKAVKIPVTVKMRKGWDEHELNAPDVARAVEQAGAAAITIHGRTAKQSYSGAADWEFVARVADALTIPVFGSGDCIEPAQIVERLRHGVSGVFVGRGVLRNPWILAQAQDLLQGRPARAVSTDDRGQFLLDYIELLQTERLREDPSFRHQAPRQPSRDHVEDAGFTDHAEGVGFSPASTRYELAPRHDRWVINKVRALCSWYTKGFENGSHLRIQVNAAQSLGELRDLIRLFFLSPAMSAS
ncbi:MAG: tRNA dihydrouridine synthase DusB [Acidobacteria bacterium]|nr:tRNA dihydrouridine synthase DusB [Acidobacteriota bacterium]